MQKNGTKFEWVPNNKSNNAAYKSVAKEDSSYKETTFNKLENAQITGTKGKDDYKLNDCKDTHVDISQDDGVKDNVFANKNSTGITVDKADGDIKNDLGEKLAYVVIYLLGMSEILGIYLEKEILYKINKNIHREYKVINGVNTRLKEYEE